MPRKLLASLAARTATSMRPITADQFAAVERDWDIFETTQYADTVDTETYQNDLHEGKSLTLLGMRYISTQPGINLESGCQRALRQSLAADGLQKRSHLTYLPSPCFHLKSIHLLLPNGNYGKVAIAAQVQLTTGGISLEDFYEHVRTSGRTLTLAY